MNNKNGYQKQWPPTLQTVIVFVGILNIYAIEKNHFNLKGAYYGSKTKQH